MVSLCKTKTSTSHTCNKHLFRDLLDDLECGVSVNYSSLVKVSSTRLAMADGIGGLILEGVCPKKKSRRELQLGSDLRVIRDAQIILCDIFG